MAQAPGIAPRGMLPGIPSLAGRLEVRVPADHLDRARGVLRNGGFFDDAEPEQDVDPIEGETEGRSAALGLGLLLFCFPSDPDCRSDGMRPELRLRMSRCGGVVIGHY